MTVIFNSESFDGINEFDCHIIDLYKNNGGSYCTVLPISPKEYRKCHKTSARVKVDISHPIYTLFNIYDDWGTLHKIYISKYHSNEIKYAIECAKRENLIMED